MWEYQAVLIKYTHHYQNGREKKSNSGSCGVISRNINCTYCHKSHPSVTRNVISDVKARKSSLLTQGPSDRDPLRFIGLDDIHKDNTKEVVHRFCRVVFGVTRSPFLLNITIKQHLQKYANGNPELVKALLNSLYVDDMTSGDSTVERGTRIRVE